MSAPSQPLAPFPWLDVVIILLLVALNGVFSMSELAVVSSRKPRLKAMARAGRRGAQTALDLASDPGRFLSTVQIGITLIGIIAGAYSGASLGGPVGQRIALLGVDPETAQTLGFILVIAALVQFVEIVLKKMVPPLYQALGIYLPLITTNCAVLGAALLAVTNEYDVVKSTVYGFSAGVGFTLALVLFSGVREKIENADVPDALKGIPAALIAAALVSVSFFGFQGLFA